MPLKSSILKMRDRNALRPAKEQTENGIFYGLFPKGILQDFHFAVFISNIQSVRVNDLQEKTGCTEPRQAIRIQG